MLPLLHLGMYGVATKIFFRYCNTRVVVTFVHTDAIGLLGKKHTNTYSRVWHGELLSVT